MSYNDVYKLRFKTFKDVREIIAHTQTLSWFDQYLSAWSKTLQR
jgi:hypothetical protein